MTRIWLFITTLKNAVGNFIFIAILGFIIFALFSSDEPDIPDSAVLILDPEGVLVEKKRPVDPFDRLFAGEDAESVETLSRDITDAIHFATEDERIKAIALDVSKISGSTLSQYEEIIASLNRFKETDRKVYAFATGYTQSQYYLASNADKIYIDKNTMNIFGGVFLQGVGTYSLYMKSAVEKLKINPNVMTAGLYKSAAEGITRDNMSEYSKEANQELIDALWGNYTQTIATQRDLTVEQVESYADSYHHLIQNTPPAQLAVDQGLVDGLLTRSEWREEMKEIAGESGDTYSHVGYRSYLAASRPPIPVDNPTTDKIAVIVAKGTIIDGDQPSGDVGGDSVARLIREARDNKNVKAVVLRVDSPGGSASASELIRSELALTQERGKPVVASMGGYAASGGYWISSTANRIYASETTITGSIGVVAVFPTFEQSAAELGVFSDGIGTSTLSGAFNQFKDMDPAFKSVMQSSITRTYDRFMELVSEGRGLSIAEVSAIAEGRVWTGERALEHGLIDAIGGIDDAIESAAMLADVTDYEVVYLEKQLSARDQVLQQILDTSVSILVRFQIESYAGFSMGLTTLVPEEIREIVNLVNKPGIYLHCLTCQVSF